MKVTSVTKVASLFVMVSLVGCSVADKLTKVVDPCSGPGACEVDGYDWTVDDLTIDAPVVAEISRSAVFAGGTVTATYRIHNRGKEVAPATTLYACLAWSASGSCMEAAKSISVPSLKQGDSYGGTVTLTSTVANWGDHAVTVYMDDSDTEWQNSSKTLNLLVERPQLKTTVVSLSSETQAGVAMPVVVSIKNSAYVASAGASTGRVCTRQSWTDCRSDASPKQVSTPALKPGETRVDTVNYTVPLSTLSYADSREQYEILACADVNKQVSQQDPDSNCATKSFTLLPNFDLSCPPQSITVGQTFTGTIAASGCRLSYVTQANLYKFSGAANTRYTLTVTSISANQGLDLSVVSDRGDRIAYDWSVWPTDVLSFTTGAAGSYYVVVGPYSGTGQQYSIHLTQP